MTVIVREMNVDDLEAAIRLWRDTPGMGLSSADSAENLASFLQRNPGLSFAAFDQARLVGTALCGQDGRRGFIYHLAVDAACRRGGIGSRLVECCVGGLKAAGIEKCHIMVLAGNLHGLAFWQKMGWSQRGDILLMSRTV